MDFSKYEVNLPYASRIENPAVYYAYYEQQNALEDKFKADLFDDLGITDNPKANLLYAKAWEFGHSSGYSEVYSYACDLVDLIL